MNLVPFIGVNGKRLLWSGVKFEWSYIELSCWERPERTGSKKRSVNFVLSSLFTCPGVVWSSSTGEMGGYNVYLHPSHFMKKKKKFYHAILTQNKTDFNWLSPHKGTTWWRSDDRKYPVNNKDLRVERASLFILWKCPATPWISWDTVALLWSVNRKTSLSGVNANIIKYMCSKTEARCHAVSSSGAWFRFYYRTLNGFYCTKM